MRAILVLAMCVFCAPALAGDVYKWVDKDGKTHFGDRPKTGGEEVEIRTGGGKGPALHDPAEVVRVTEHDAECQRRKQKLGVYKAAPSISETDNLGKMREYSEQERLEFIKRYEQQTAEACAPLEPLPPAK